MKSIVELALRWASISVLCAALLTGAAIAQTATKTDEKPENYPDAPHRDSTFYFCSACHGFKLIAQQGLNASQWNEVIDTMEQKHGAAETRGEERDALVEYLSTAFPQKKKQGWRNPFQE
ncbi:MAG: hypothetical protein B7Y80_20370 [Hyphomicrobium sp. 32-62-53]|nr:MAG: hypothetical protein B7Y80_20370 [Hyphomicrobium sp. 32-62-53]